MLHLIVNRHNLNRKNLKKINQATDVFDRADKKYQFHYTDHPGHAREIAEEICKTDKNAEIIALGGDGTLHEIINGLDDPSKHSLGLIPMGTGNDFAAAARIPQNPKLAAEIIAFLPPKKIDYIQLSSGLRSINAVGMGIDVDVLKRAAKGKNRRKSKYLHALIVSLCKFRSIRYKVIYDGVEEEKYGLIAAVGNGRQIGGGIKLFPEADISDGLLDIVVVDYISKPAMISAFIKLMRGKVNKIKCVTAVKTKAVEIIPDTENFTIQAEGELYENVPISAHIAEGGLNFFLPLNDD